MKGVNASLPDFIVVGAMKSATSTLHEQLARQPNIFMTTPKEPNFFSDDDVYAKGIAWYASLFDAAGEGDLKGESSTHYTKLPTYPLVLDRMRDANLGNSRFIYIIRHPVDRLISHYMHEVSQGIVRAPIDKAVALHPELIEYSLYFKQISPYVSTFGPERVLIVFFDSLKTRSQYELERVCRFIGYRGTPRWDDSLGKQNVSAERIKKFPLYSLLVDTKFMRLLRRTLIPKSIRSKVRAKLTLDAPPVLTAGLSAELERIFDQDLAQLGKLLGVELNCANFKVTALS